MKILKTILLFSLLGSTTLLAGCASPATAAGMVPKTTPPMKTLRTHALERHVTVNGVRGGERTNPLWTSEVGNREFNMALIGSLKNAHLYAPLSKSRYYLNAHLVELKKPVIGLDLTDLCKVHYTLTNNKTNKTLFDKTISSSYTAKFKDAFLAVKRLRLANEGAVRMNIKQLIKALYQLKLA